MMENQKLLELARAAAENAYAPYSGYMVGAALLADDGTVFTGCNVENVSSPLCTCAERTALCKAISEGHYHFTAIAIAETDNSPCLPCGACRQMLAEFCKDDLHVIVAGSTPEEPCHTYLLRELLPNAFRFEKSKG